MVWRKQQDTKSQSIENCDQTEVGFGFKYVLLICPTCHY